MFQMGGGWVPPRWKSRMTRKGVRMGRREMELAHLILYPLSGYRSHTSPPESGVGSSGAPENSQQQQQANDGDRAFCCWINNNHMHGDVHDSDVNVGI